jgi:hypothetical protein
MPELARVITTDAEIDLAIQRAKKHAKYDRRVVKATYSRTMDDLRLTLDDGVVCSIPRRLIQGISGAQRRYLKPIQILGDGTGLLWPLLDVSHYVPALLSGVYGSARWMDQLARSSSKIRAFPRTPGIESRLRDVTGSIREKSGRTLVGTLRKTYGEDFLSDWRGDVKLSTVRDETDMSLSEMVRQHMLGRKLRPISLPSS